MKTYWIVKIIPIQILIQNQNLRRTDFVNPIRLMKSRTRSRSYQTRNLALSREVSGSTAPVVESQPKTSFSLPTMLWVTQIPGARLSGVDSYRGLKLAWSNLHMKRSDCSTWSLSMSRSLKQCKNGVPKQLVSKKPKSIRRTMPCPHFVIVDIQIRYLPLMFWS